MGAARCTAKTLVGFASTVFLILGVALIAGNIASLVTFVGELVPDKYAYVGIGVGVVIFLLSVAGFVSICTPKKRKCPLVVFMIFDFIIFLTLAVTAFFVLRSSDVIDALDKAGFTNVTDSFDRGVANVVEDGVKSTLTVCNANVAPLPPYVTSTGQLYLLTCSDSDWNIVSDIVNGNCMGSDHAVVNFVNETTNFKSCFVDNSFWTASYSGPVVWDAIGSMLNTPKGVFCQCYSTLSDVYQDYFAVIAGVSIGIASFFGLVFLATCYLLCCAKTKDDEANQLTYNTPYTDQSYMARP